MISEAFQLMEKQPLDGCVIEFGVWKGDGLQVIAVETWARLGKNIPIYGFDSFEGMPRTEVELKDNHAIVWKEGNYGDTSIIEVRKRFPNQNVKLFKGVFGELPPLIAFGIEKVRFARLDCDIYEGYRDALKLLTPCIQKGTVLLFDEINPPDDPRYHDSIRDSGCRAVYDWQIQTGWRLNRLKDQGTEALTQVLER